MLAHYKLLTTSSCAVLLAEEAALTKSVLFANEYTPSIPCGYYRKQHARGIFWTRVQSGAASKHLARSIVRIVMYERPGSMILQVVQTSSATRKVTPSYRERNPTPRFQHYAGGPYFYIQLVHFSGVERK